MTDMIYVNINLDQLQFAANLPVMAIRLGDCFATTGSGTEAETFQIISNGCPTTIGLTEIVWRQDREIEFSFQNFIDRRGHRGSTQVNIRCEISKLSFSLRDFPINYLCTYFLGMCHQTCGAAPVCNSNGKRRRRGIPDSEIELLESDLFEEDDTLSLPGKNFQIL